jgi:predicted TIM-barrel fold metal-dependent hydrolase
LKDAGVANAELHRLVGDDPQRFFPVYTLDPTFPTWRLYLDQCVGDYGLAPGTGAVRLFPRHHGYQLDDAAIDPCLDRLEALGLPLLLTWQLEDARMQAPGMHVPDLDPESVAGLAARRPSLRLLVTGAVQSQIMATLRRLAPAAPVWFDISRVQGPIDGIPILCRATAAADGDADDEARHPLDGARRLVFGTNLPLHVAQSPILELADAILAGLSQEGAAAIGRGNARAVLGLDAGT